LGNSTEYPSVGTSYYILLPYSTKGFEISNLSSNGTITLTVKNQRGDVVVKIEELDSIEQTPLIIGSQVHESIMDQPLSGLNVSMQDQPVHVVFDLTFWVQPPPPVIDVLIVYPLFMILALASIIVYAMVRLAHIHAKFWDGINGPAVVVLLILSSLILILPYFVGYLRGDFEIVGYTDAVYSDHRSFALNETAPMKIYDKNIAIPQIYGRIDTIAYRLESTKAIRLTALNRENDTLTEFDFSGTQLEWWSNIDTEDLDVYRWQLSYLTDESEVRFSYIGYRNELRERIDPLPSLSILAFACMLISLAILRAARLDFELGKGRKPLLEDQIQ
jgi:hypothetical protein